MCSNCKNISAGSSRILLELKGLAVTTMNGATMNGAPRSRVGVGTMKVEPPGGTKESTGDQSEQLTEKYKH